MLYLPAAAAAAGPYDQVARCPACEDVILTSRGVECADCTKTRTRNVTLEVIA